MLSTCTIASADGQLVLIDAKTSLVLVLACPSSSIMFCILFLMRLWINACRKERLCELGSCNLIQRRYLDKLCLLAAGGANVGD